MRLCRGPDRPEAAPTTPRGASPFQRTVCQVPNGWLPGSCGWIGWLSTDLAQALDKPCALLSTGRTSSCQTGGRSPVPFLCDHPAAVRHRHEEPAGVPSRAQWYGVDLRLWGDRAGHSAPRSRAQRPELRRAGALAGARRVGRVPGTQRHRHRRQDPREGDRGRAAVVGVGGDPRARVRVRLHGAGLPAAVHRAAGNRARHADGGGPTGRTQRRRQARPARLHAVEGRQTGRTIVADALGSRPAGLAPGVLGDGHHLPGAGVRRARRWRRPGVPAPRERAGAVQRGRRPVRPVLAAQRLGHHVRREDVQVAG